MRMVVAVPLKRWLIVLALVLAGLVAVPWLRAAAAGRLEQAVALPRAGKPAHTPLRRAAPKPEDYDVIAASGLLGTAAKASPKSAPNKPTDRLWGILGSTALFGPASNKVKPYQVGAAISSGEKIAEIHADHVMLEKDNKRRTEPVFSPDKKPVAAPTPSPAKKPSKPGSRPKRPGRPPTPTVSPTAPAPGIPEPPSGMPEWVSKQIEAQRAKAGGPRR